MSKEEKEYINEVNVYLAVTDFTCKHSRITEILGVDPTSVWVKGELINGSLGGISRFGYNSWLYEIKRNDVIYVQKLIDKVIKTFENKIDNFKKLPKNSEVHLEIVLYLDKGMPSIVFSKKNIKFLSDINASVDFDMYGI
jgi:hypothetical protein